jgi:hypothetical protein
MIVSSSGKDPGARNRNVASVSITDCSVQPTPPWERHTNGARCLSKRYAAAGVAGCAREKNTSSKYVAALEQAKKARGHDDAFPATDAPGEGRAEDFAAEGLAVAAGGATEECRRVGPRHYLEHKLRRKHRRRGRERATASLAFAWRRHGPCVQTRTTSGEF